MQLRDSRAELDRSKGEAAAAGVRISSLESQLQTARATLTSRDSEIQQQKVSIENQTGKPGNWLEYLPRVCLYDCAG